MQQELQERLMNIAQLLLEVATGNLCFALPPRGEDQELDAVVELVKLACDQLRSSLYIHGRVLPYPSHNYLVQSTFLLDDSFRIAGLSTECNFFPESLINTNGILFLDLLDASSKPAWESLCKTMSSQEHHHATIQINFITKTLARPAFCTVSTLLHSTKIIVSVVAIVYDESIKNNPLLLNQHYGRAREESFGVELQEYILSHLELPLPSIKTLAGTFGTNELYLKNVFRQLFKTSIYRFYTNERLKRAHLLIQQTRLPLYEISERCGFGSYNNFSKAFTKKFGYAANSVRNSRLKN